MPAAFAYAAIFRAEYDLISAIQQALMLKDLFNYHGVTLFRAVQR